MAAVDYQGTRLEDRRPRGQWERNTRAPVPLPPKGSCDCQFHIFGDPTQYPIRHDQEAAIPQASFADIRRVLGVLGIERGVIVHSQRYESDHSLLIDTLEQLAPDERKNFRATSIIRDSVSDAEMARLNSLGICAGRFNIGRRWVNAKDTTEIRRSMERVREIGWHARLHIAGSDLAEWGEFLLSFRDLPMVIDHMAHLDFSLGVQQPAVKWIQERLRNDANWWVKLSNGPRDSAFETGWDDAIPFARAFIEAAPDRMIWGTDWPHTGWRRPRMMNDAELVELLYRYADHDEALIRKILVTNPARLHGFES